MDDAEQRQQGQSQRLAKVIEEERKQNSDTIEARHMSLRRSTDQTRRHLHSQTPREIDSGVKVKVPGQASGRQGCQGSTSRVKATRHREALWHVVRVSTVPQTASKVRIRKKSHAEAATPGRRRSASLIRGLIAGFLSAPDRQHSPEVS